MLDNEKIILGKISKAELIRMRDNKEEVCFRARGKDVCGLIKKVNPTTVDVAGWRIKHTAPSLTPQIQVDSL